MDVARRGRGQPVGETAHVHATASICSYRELRDFVVLPVTVARRPDPGTGEHAPSTARQLANALDIMEPLAKRGNLGKVVADRLASLGLAEKGRPSDRYFAIGMTVGYRLTPLG